MMDIQEIRLFSDLITDRPGYQISRAICLALSLVVEITKPSDQKWADWPQFSRHFTTDIV